MKEHSLIINITLIVGWVGHCAHQMYLIIVIKLIDRKIVINLRICILNWKVT